MSPNLNIRCAGSEKLHYTKIAITLSICIHFIIIIIKIYTALIDIETYNQSVKVSACEGIDRYTYTCIYTKPNLQYTIRSL